MSGISRKTFPFGSCGSIARYDGMPSMFEIVRSTLPIVLVAR
jgi:hypothetical protein